MFRKFKSEQLDFITKICEEHYEGKFDKYEKVRNEFGKFLAVGRKGSLIFECEHKISKYPVTMKIISKKKLGLPEIDELRDMIKMYQIYFYITIVTFFIYRKI